MADDVKVDPEDFTIEELETVEDLTGRSISDLFPAGRASASGLRAVVFIQKRREDPAFTWDDAGKFKFNQIEVGSEPDPTTAAAD